MLPALVYEAPKPQAANGLTVRRMPLSGVGVLFPSFGCREKRPDGKRTLTSHIEFHSSNSRLKRVSSRAAQPNLSNLPLESETFQRPADKVRRAISALASSVA